MLLSWKGLTYSYRSAFQLGPVEGAAQSGQILALLGPNGAGKTTLLRLLAGLLVPERGSFLWNGGPVPRFLLLERVAWIPSEPTFPPGCTILDLLRLRAQAVRTDWREPAESLQRALARPLCTLPHQLSRGQRLRLALGLALLGHPEVILADEPWSGLDPLAQDEVLAQMRARAEAGAAVLVSSHDLGQLAGVADRFLLLQRGQVRFEGGVEEVARSTPGETDPARALKLLYRRSIE